MKKKEIKKRDDSIALRISIGGNNELSYCVYRGDLKKIQMLLSKVTEEMVALKDEPEISPDDGKKYA